MNKTADIVHLNRDFDSEGFRPLSWCTAIAVGGTTSRSNKIGNWWLIGEQMFYVRLKRENNLGWHWYGANDPADTSPEVYLGFEWRPNPDYEIFGQLWVHPDLYETYEIQ